ncbi:MAG: pyridoxamine 5'-phosphate oxidase family protein [Myxococcota bacterium]|nr:pyridoxamine 5'-phosphate oxidase family protein [Myxococcota bacterium]
MTEIDQGALARAQGEARTWFEQLWLRLEESVGHDGEPWRLPTVATVGLDGAPRARMMVLRGACATARTLELCSDTRAEKVAEWYACPKVALCFWDPAQGVQLRARGHVHPLGEAEVEARRSSLSTTGLRLYQGTPAPGMPLGAPEGHSVGAEVHMSVLRCTLYTLDALALSSPAHRRMRAVWKGEAWALDWVAP